MAEESKTEESTAELQTQSFSYEAQSQAGKSFAGSIDATDIDNARDQLVELGLRIVAIEPAAKPARQRKLTGDDFAIFNQQLAFLTDAGLPIERSLRLIGKDMRSGRLSKTIEEIADELERGTSLPDAFAKHKKRFPPMYSQLVEAGVETGQLSAMLFSLSRHTAMVQRLRQLLIESLTYPAIVLVAVIGLLIFMNEFVLSEFRDMYSDFYYEMPAFTTGMFDIFDWLLPRDGTQMVPGLVIVLVAPLIAYLLIVLPTVLSRKEPIASGLVLRIPLVGSILRWGMVSRWCNALAISVNSGLDLPKAVKLSCSASGSKHLKQEAAQIEEAVSSEQIVNSWPSHSLLPETIPTAIELAMNRGNLGQTMTSMSQMYEKLAEVRINMLNTVMMPTMLIAIGVLVFVMTGSLFMPLVRLVTSLT